MWIGEEASGLVAAGSPDEACPSDSLRIQAWLERFKETKNGVSSIVDRSAINLGSPIDADIKILLLVGQQSVPYGKKSITSPKNIFILSYL